MNNWIELDFYLVEVEAFFLRLLIFPSSVFFRCRLPLVVSSIIYKLNHTKTTPPPSLLEHDNNLF